MVCPDCNTENNYIYVGMIHIKCTNTHCRHFDKEVYKEWEKTQIQMSVFDPYDGLLIPEDS